MYSLAERQQQAQVPGPCEVAVVLPTFNEAQNIGPILDKIEVALRGVAWEAIFVDDDSKDGTPAAVVDAARHHGNVRIVRRLGRRGLSSAVVEGALSSMAPYVAVMDSDMQHDERLLAGMLDELRTGACDLVVGTRYVDGGGVGEWSKRRQTISRAATWMARSVSGLELSDPMSGFFMMRRDTFESVVRHLSGQGFKILLDIVASAKQVGQPMRIVEKPYTFQPRQFGESKLDSMIAFEFMMLLLDKLVGRYVPVRFLMFVAVGGLGLVFHMTVLYLTFKLLRSTFAFSQGAATICAMTFNFFVNNYLTYRDRRLKGVKGLTLGLLSFFAVCSLGAVANIGIANYVFDSRHSWWLAGVAGVLVGAVWNYAASSVFTWRAVK